MTLVIPPGGAPARLTTFQVGDILEHTDGPRKGRRVRVMMCLYDRYALRSVTTNRLSYVRTSMLRSKHYRLVERTGNKGAEHMIPTIGRIVLYTLNMDDATAINRRRTDGPSIRDRMQSVPPLWPEGAQAHIGNGVKEGDVFPMLITRVWGTTPESAVNGQVMLDGNDCYWATSVVVGEGPRTFQWPTRS